MEYRVFFSHDCMMYGVENKIVDNGSGRTNFWQQVLPPRSKGGRGGQSAYTYYEGVAKRWMNELLLQECDGKHTNLNELFECASCAVLFSEESK